MRGLIYSLSLYLLFLLISGLILVSINSNTQIIEQQIYFEDQKEILKILDQVSNILKNNLEVNVSLYRNNTTISLSVQDRGFPLKNYNNYQKNLTAFLEFLEKIKQIKNCTLESNLSLINQSGKILITNFGINYSHNNSNQNYDQIKLKIEPNSQINRIETKIRCNRPSFAQTVSYLNWQTTGNNIAANITFLDGTENYNNFVYINPNFSNNFSATYLDSAGNLIYEVKLDYLPNSYEIIFWSQTNSTYNPPYTKSNVSCSIDFQIFINGTAYQEIYIALPATVITTCKNTGYRGELILFKK